MLNGAVCPVTLAVGAAGIAAAGYFASQAEEKPSAAKFAGVTALIFALQMLNFPVQNGTSGHLIGAMLGVSLLGIPFAVLAMGIVLFIQAVFFGDGGINALGANVFNMGILGAALGGLLLQKMKTRGIQQTVSLGIAAWASTMIAALACSIEVALSGAVTLSKVIPAMLSVHALIGLGEAGLTLAVVAILNRFKQSQSSENRFAISALGLAVIAAMISPLASGFPDGLEWVAEKLSFVSFSGIDFPALFPDYQATFIAHPGISTVTAGLVGVALAFGITFLIGKSLKGQTARAI